MNSSTRQHGTGRTGAPAPIHVVDTRRFTGEAELSERHRRLDARGLRATASPAHEEYVDELAERLRALGLDVLVEEVPVERWTPSSWSLVVGGSPVHVGSYLPYSGTTPAGGVRGPLSFDPAPGAIGVVDVAVLPLQEQHFAMLDWDAPDLPTIPDGHDLEAPYERVWLSQEGIREQVAAFAAAGAAGLVLVVDGEAVEVDGSYLLYDGVLRGLPTLVVDRHVGADLRKAVPTGADATLTLEAVVEPAVSRNVSAIVPGVSEELVLVQSHTDGTNALEDNGPEAIVAMAEYLVGLDRAELPRGVLLVLSTGHFVTHTAWGLAAFLRAHRHDLLERTVAAISIEHLGARAWRPREEGYDVSADFELGCFFSTNHRVVVDAVRNALDRAEVTNSLVLRPFVADETGEAPDGMGWPGDGMPLWGIGHLPSANFITGPGYLLTEMSTLDLIDVAAMRRQTIAFLEALLELAHADAEALTRTAR